MTNKPVVYVFYRYTDSVSKFARLFSPLYDSIFLMKPTQHFRQMLKDKGYSKEAIDELWKWYDSTDKKGVASY